MHHLHSDLLFLKSSALTTTFIPFSQHFISASLGNVHRQARNGNPTFRLTYFQNDGIMYYILISTAPLHRQDFWFSYFRTPKSELRFGGLLKQRPLKRLPSFFLFSRILLSSSYLVPKYIRYLRRKTVV